MVRLQNEIFDCFGLRVKQQIDFPIAVARETLSVRLDRVGYYRVMPDLEKGRSFLACCALFVIRFG